MSRHLAALCLVLTVVALAQPASRAAAPPISQEIILPRNLDDLRALDARVQRVLSKISPATVGLGGGSGVVVSKDGLVLTVAHVGQKAGRDVTVIFPDGRRAKGKTLGNYRGVDAGLVKLSDKGPWPYVEMGKSTGVKPGQWCLALGYPVSFSKGMKPPVRIGRVLRQSATTVVSDCPIMGGDSGGPFFDLDGRVIGVHSRVSGSMLGNMHVTIDVYHTNWKRLMAGEDWGSAGPTKGRRPNPSPAAPEFPTFEVFLQQRPGGRLTGFERNHETIRSAFREAVTPASKSTVRILVDEKAVMLGTVVSADGLIVTKASLLGGKVTCKLPDGKVALARVVGQDKELDLALLKVEAKGLQPVRWRAGDPPVQGSLVASVGEDGSAVAIGMITAEPRQFRVQQRPKADPTRGAQRGYLGMNGQPIEKRGLKVDRLTPGAPAEKAGLKVGDVIKKVGDQAVGSTEQLISVLMKHKPGDRLALAVQRGEKELALTVTLGKPPEETTRPPYDRWGGGPFSERRFGFPKVLAHDTVLSPRDCGGPLVDTRGQVVGLNISRSLRISTYALLPADVERVVKTLVAAGERKKENGK